MKTFKITLEIISEMSETEIEEWIGELLNEGSLHLIGEERIELAEPGIEEVK